MEGAIACDGGVACDLQTGFKWLWQGVGDTECGVSGFGIAIDEGPLNGVLSRDSAGGVAQGQ